MRPIPCTTSRYLRDSIWRPSTSPASLITIRQPLSLANRQNISTSSPNAVSTARTPTSTVHIGTTYEYLCAQTLPRLGFTNITRTGGRSDRGIDLLAHWVLSPLPPSSSSSSPSSSSSSLNGKTLRAIIQCKALAGKPGPEMIRELEGAVAGAPVDWASEDTVGVLCARREATEGVRQAVRRSGRGVVWVMVEEVGDGGSGDEGMREGVGRRGRVKQVLWNERVGKAVGGRVGAGVRYVKGEKGMEKEVCLMVDGLVWEPHVEGLGS